MWDQRKAKKLVYYAVGLVLGLAILVASQLPDGKTRIIACDVGQGDAILLIRGSVQVLIDGGPSSQKVLTCLSRHMPFWDRKVELIVLTNTDYDHMTGVVAVLERYSTLQFAMADGVQESSTLIHLTAILRERRVPVAAVAAGNTIAVHDRGGVAAFTFRVLWPPDTDMRYVAAVAGNIDSSAREQILGASAKKVETNTRSVVLLLTSDSYRALFTGDSGVPEEKDMLAEGVLGKIDYLKVGHHGSKYSSSLEFLGILQPTVAVISVGLGNAYGHPTPDVLDRLGMVGATIMRTDKEGDVVTELP